MGIIKNAKATAVNNDSGETVELKKKDAHALGLLCYAESELQEYMHNYCNVYTHDGAGLLRGFPGDA